MKRGNPEGVTGNASKSGKAEDEDELSLARSPDEQKAFFWGRLGTGQVRFVTEIHNVCVTTDELISWIIYCNTNNTTLPPHFHGGQYLTYCLDYILGEILKVPSEQWRKKPISRRMCPILDPNDLYDWMEENEDIEITLVEYVDREYRTLIERGPLYEYRHSSARWTIDDDRSSVSTMSPPESPQRPEGLDLYGGRRRGRGKKTIKRKRNIKSRRSKTGRKSRSKSRRSRRA